MSDSQYVVWFDDLRMTDVSRVGGKNASLGEMISQLTKAGVCIPNGFATTADAYREFLAQGGLAQRINQMLDRLDTDDVTALAAAGTEIRAWIVETPLPPRLKQEIAGAYEKMLREAGPVIFRWRCVPRQPRKIWPMLRLPDSRKHILIFTGWTIC